MKITKARIIIGIITIIALWAISGYLTHRYSYEDRGTFGDMFGAINALFSGLALFGIIVSILIQQKELNLQRQELAETRQEFKINRISNILFSQIEQINSYLDKQLFFPSPDLTLEHRRNLIEFTLTLDGHFGSGRNEKIFILLGGNKNTIIGIITKLSSIILSFNELIKKQGFDEKEIVQIQKLFKNNINSFAYKLLTYRLSDLHNQLNFETDKPKSKVTAEENRIQQNMINSEIRNINVIMNFGKG